MKMERLVQQIGEIIKTETNPIRFSSKVFGPDGLFAKYAPGREERENLIRSDIWRKARARLKELTVASRKKFEADVDKYKPSSPIRLSVSLPRSVYARLRSDAQKEGTTISEEIRRELYLFQAATDKLLDGLVSSMRQKEDQGFKRRKESRLP